MSFVDTTDRVAQLFGGIGAVVLLGGLVVSLVGIGVKAVLGAARRAPTGSR